MKGWIDAISKRLKTDISYSDQLYEILVNQANHLRLKFRKLKHGQQQHEFLEKQWELKIEPSELCVVKLRKQNEKLTSQLASSTKRVKELKAEVVNVIK